MAVQVDQVGYGQLVDAVAAGTASSGSLIYEDGNTNPPWIDRPWAGRESYIVSEAMRVAEVPAEEIRKIRPMVPQLLFPDEGVAYDRQSLTIEDVFETDRWSPTVRSWISGPSRQVRRADMQEDLWSGTLRNAANPVNPMI